MDQNVLLYQLTGDSYIDFTNRIVQYTKTDSSEEITGTVIKGAVPHNYTIQEAIIIAANDGNMYAAELLDGKKIRYYTTDEDHVNKLPSYVTNWKSRFSDVPIEKYYMKR